MLYVWTYLWCVPSPVLMVINAEAWVITHALLNHGQPLPLAACAAAGQLTCYVATYAGCGHLVARWPALRTRVQRFDAGKYTKAAYLALLIGAITGAPPTLWMTLCSRVLGYTFPRYVVVVACGRFIRFALLAYLPDAFAKLLHLNGAAPGS